jgi:hypothetical protein
MFSRRVFELLACGTPVISTYSRGIVELLGEGVVFLTESEADTRRHLERLLGSEEEWARASVRGIRKVMSEHTYRDRLREVFERVGIALPEPRAPRISVLIRVASEDDLSRVGSLLSAQTCRPVELVLASGTRLPPEAVTSIRNALPHTAVTNAHGQPAEILALCQEALSADYIAFMDAGDSYGPHYLKDHGLAAMYSGADFLGKQSYYAARSGAGRHLRQAGREFGYVNSIGSATLMVKKAALSASLLAQALNGCPFRLQEDRILSIDRFNYLQNCEAKPHRERPQALSDVECAEVYA